MAEYERKEYYALNKDFENFYSYSNEGLQALAEVARYYASIKPEMLQSATMAAQCIREAIPVESAQLIKSARESLSIISKDLSEIINASRHEGIQVLAATLRESIAYTDLRETLKGFDFTAFAEQLRISPSAILPDDQDVSDPVSVSEDYVTIDAPNSNEIVIPDSVSIPAGQKRIRIKTEVLIGILLTIFFELAQLVVSCYSAYDEHRYREEIVSIEHERTEMLRDWLSSIDTSASQQSDTIENLVFSIEELSDHLQVREALHP